MRFYRIIGNMLQPIDSPFHGLDGLISLLFPYLTHVSASGESGLFATMTDCGYHTLYTQISIPEFIRNSYVRPQRHLLLTWFRITFNGSFKLFTSKSSQLHILMVWSWPAVIKRSSAQNANALTQPSWAVTLNLHLRWVRSHTRTWRRKNTIKERSWHQAFHVFRIIPRQSSHRWPKRISFGNVCRYTWFHRDDRLNCRRMVLRTHALVWPSSGHERIPAELQRGVVLGRSCEELKIRTKLGV